VEAEAAAVANEAVSSIVFMIDLFRGVEEVLMNQYLRN
jgi:hypothetical protein